MVQIEDEDGIEVGREHLDDHCDVYDALESFVCR